MGKAQLIEFALKKILRKRYRYGERKLERLTIGVAISELDRLGMRKDFIALLRELSGTIWRTCFWPTICISPLWIKALDTSH
jgi:hypothetical protein